MERAKRIVNAKNVYDWGCTGQGVRVALLDSGVFLHDDIKANVLYFKDFINHRNICYDDNGHGTHIAGILCNMAPKVELLVFKILDEKGSGSTKTALQAVDWLIENHKEWNIKLLNFSMGYLPNANPKLQNQLLEKLEYLWEEGVTIVTAAGNNGPEENTITVPGVSRKLITVGSSDDVDKGKNSYTGKGPTACCIVKPEVLAPGTEILSLSNEPGKYTRKSGTSMSVPIVCGALALALEKNPTVRPVELKLLIYDSVSRKNKNLNGSWGILNVDNLIKML